ncbi:MAG TPA: hypothetical protein VFG15_30150 [Amycolatopsis sp.]|nr:hypothetical protein [Amycolatopsis sp.]
MTKTIDLNTILLIIEHAKVNQIKDERFAGLSCSGLGLSLLLPHHEIPLFYQWVRNLDALKIVARRHHNQPGALEAYGATKSGLHFSVLVEMDRRLLVEQKMIGRVELSRVAEFADSFKGVA